MRPIASTLCLLLLLIASTGCSGGSSEGNGTIPKIYNLSYTPKSASQYENNGHLRVFGSFGFTDIDWDIVDVWVSGPNGEDAVPIQGHMATTSGEIEIFFNVGTLEPIKFTFYVWVVDSKGNPSNTLKGEFVVR